MDMRRFSLVLLAGITALSGCSDSNDRDSEKPLKDWDAPADYTFDVTSQCGEQSFIGTFHIVVEGGEIARVKELDEEGKWTVSHVGKSTPTLSVLLGYALEAQQLDADVVDVVYDDTDGHPQRIDIDYDLNAIDDESCFVVTKYSAKS
jgi:hypothetical protein